MLLSRRGLCLRTSAEGVFFQDRPDGGDSIYSDAATVSSVAVSVSSSVLSLLVPVPFAAGFVALAFGYQLRSPKRPFGSLWNVTVFFESELRSDARPTSSVLVLKV
jgi:hypothetical protein